MITKRRKQLMKCGTVHHFIPTTEATSFNLRSVPMVKVQAELGSHLSVYIQPMRGEYDDGLEWPFEGDVTFRILNWRENKSHCSHKASFNSYTDPSCGTHSSHVISRKSSGRARFISHTSLVYNQSTNTEYLVNDHLKLRVSAVVYSTPLLHLTPAWQDSLISTQSGTQFTISEYSKRKQFNNEYYSPPFTTSPQGHTFCLLVFDNGDSDFISVFVCIMKGQHDDRLQWPFTGTIIIELLNWLEDKRHYKRTLSIGTNDDFVRVTEGNFGNTLGYSHFILHSSLTSSTTKTQYLYQDCIRVRVQAIANN